jgi:hypothetical protein
LAKTPLPDAPFEPSPLRRQHGRIARAEVQFADASGLIGRPFIAEGLLARLERHGDIGKRERLAGEEFHRLFRLAQLDPLRAADMQREGGGSASQMPHGSERARRLVVDALDSLGGQRSLCGSCAWYVVGADYTLRDWARRMTYEGRPVSQHVAKGVLTGALGVLARHFRL